MMKPFLVHEGREYYRLHLPEPGAVERILPGPYPCLLWDHAGTWEQPERDALVSSLLATDCRYAVCGGVDCERWHDDIDLDFVTTVPEPEQDARFIMTTWHTSEPPLEVAWFFAWNTDFDDHEFRHFLLVEIGHAPDPTLLQETVRRAVMESEAVLDELNEHAG